MVAGCGARATAAATSAMSGASTTTARSGRRSATTASTWSIIARPASRCSTLGRGDFIRVPLPAASTTTVTGKLMTLAPRKQKADFEGRELTRI